jgi:hypothetical protein
MSTLNVDIINQTTDTSPVPVIVIHQTDPNNPQSGITIKKAVNNFSSPNGGIAIGMAVGSDAPENGVGFQNTVIGNFASKRDNGFGNTILGYGALAGSNTVTSTTCSQSVAIGVNALGSMDTNGSDNTAVGHQAARDFKEGIYNTVIGAKALSETPTASYSTFLGWGAGGTSNVFPGTFGPILLDGVNVTCIGFDSRPSSATAESEITLGNSDIAALRCNAPLASLSDERDKKDIKSLTVGLDFVKDLKPVEFVWNDRESEKRRDIKDFGFIAQDLKKSQEDVELADTLKLVYESNPDKLEVFYGKLVPILVKAIQELSHEIEILKNK